MSKCKKDFEFSFPVTKFSPNPQKIADLTVLGYAYDQGDVPSNESRYSSKVVNVFFKDQDIWPLISLYKNDELYRFIMDAAHAHAKKILSPKDSSLILQTAGND